MSIVENWSTAVIELRLHGYPSVAVDGRPVALTLRHAFALLARLADARGRLSRAALAALLWPGVPLDTARTRLRRLVHELNRRLKLDALTGVADALWLDATRIRLVSFARIPFPKRGARSVAYRAVAAAQGVRVYVDLVAMQVGRAEAGVIYVSALTPAPAAELRRLTNVVAKRAAKAMRGA